MQSHYGAGISSKPITATPYSFAAAKMRSNHSVFMLMPFASGLMPCEVSTNTSLRSAQRRMHLRMSSMSVWYASPAMTVSRRKRELSSVAGKNARSTVWIGFSPVCFSPFGIEEISLDPSEVDQPPMEVMIALNIDPSAFDIRGSKDYLARTYSFIEESKSLLLAYRGTEHMKAFCRHGEYDYGCYLRFRDYDILASYAPRESAKPLGAGVIIEESPDCFLIFGMMCSLSFRAKPDENLRVEMISLEEGDIHDGVFKRGRILNGDEKMSVRLGDRLTCLRVELYKY